MPWGRITIRLQLFAQERTEPATPRRRREARRKGQVARSAELGGALVLLAVTFALYLLSGWIWREVSAYAVQVYQEKLVDAAAEAGQIPALLLEMTAVAARAVAPLLAIAVVVGFFSQVAQVGFLAAADPLKPQLRRIDPVSGLKRIFSKRALVELVKATLKIALIGAVAYATLKATAPAVLEFGRMPLEQAVRLTGDIVYRVALWVSLTLLVIAALDYWYHRWEFEQSIRMSKQDVREELRQTEGDPQIRAKIRQRQRQIAGMRMMAQVPKADVVITNPVHLAVALAYDAATVDAPVVVAKGAGPLAARIRETARQHNVAVVENVWLARALYESAPLNARIPEDLYQAVAEVLAFVYRLRRAGAAGGRSPR